MTNNNIMYIFSHATRKIVVETQKGNTHAITKSISTTFIYVVGHILRMANKQIIIIIIMMMVMFETLSVLIGSGIYLSYIALKIMFISLGSRRSAIL